MDYWQSIYIIYKGYDNATTNINANNKNEIMIFITSDISSYSDSPLITNNNNNNDNYNKNNNS